MGQKKIERSGIGDMIAKITKAVGLQPCESCERRREKLNQMFSFLTKTKKDLTPDEIQYINQINATNKIDNNVVFFKLYNSVFGTHMQSCNCPPVMKEMLFKLNKVIEKQSIVDDTDI